MIALSHYKEPIISFINESIRSFNETHGSFKSLGLYCCQWSGWVSVNFNVNKTLAKVYNSCPDFEFVEFDMIDFEEWQQEYERDTPVYDTGIEVVKHIHDQGDEVVNKLFFDFLTSVVIDLKKKLSKPILLQMLDSEYCSVF